MTQQQGAREGKVDRSEHTLEDSKDVAASIQRIARTDRRILLELAAFDRGERAAN
jgi:hypothetical protein